MINTFITNIQNAKKFKGTFSEKVSAVYILSKLYIKSKFFYKKNKVVSDTIFDFRIFGYDYSALYFLFDEVFMSNEYYFKYETDEPVIIDCGANIGTSVLYFKKLFPKSKIIAFEANPHTYKLLEKNVSENNLINVELINLALFDKETEISFFIGENIGTLVGSINKERGGETELKVKTQKLSNYLKNIDAVDLIKIDVEGAEINIINDLVNSNCLNKAKEYIIEYHHNIKDDKSSLSSFLQKFELNGFNYNIKAEFSEIDTMQDILIHLYKK
jgi:FkbM family methyltransferase